jgi:hypothetical protein
VAEAIMTVEGTSTRGVPFLFEGLLVKCRETILPAQKRLTGGASRQGAQRCLNSRLAGEHLREVRKLILAKPFHGHFMEKYFAVSQFRSGG